jgi:hypothetical protein
MASFFQTLATLVGSEFVDPKDCGTATVVTQATCAAAGYGNPNYYVNPTGYCDPGSAFYATQTNCSTRGFGPTQASCAAAGFGPTQQSCLSGGFGPTQASCGSAGFGASEANCVSYAASTGTCSKYFPAAIPTYTPSATECSSLYGPSQLGYKPASFIDPQTTCNTAPCSTGTITGICNSYNLYKPNNFINPNSCATSTACVDGNNNPTPCCTATAQDTPWRCVNVSATDDIPVRRKDGNIQCMSNDGTNCMWTKKGVHCDWVADHPPSNLNPVIAPKPYSGWSQLADSRLNTMADTSWRSNIFTIKDNTGKCINHKNQSQWSLATCDPTGNTPDQLFYYDSVTSKLRRPSDGACMDDNNITTPGSTPFFMNHSCPAENSPSQTFYYNPENKMLTNPNRGQALDNGYGAKVSYYTPDSANPNQRWTLQPINY